MQTTLSSASSPQSSSKYSPGVFMLGQLKPANHTPHFKPSFDWQLKPTNHKRPFSKAGTVFLLSTSYKDQLYVRPSIHPSRAFPGLPKDTVPPACPESSRGPPTGGTCPERFTREASGRHPRCPNHLIWLLSVRRSSASTLSSSWMPKLLPLSLRRAQPPYKANFSRLYPRSRSFGHYPKLIP